MAMLYVVYSLRTSKGSGFGRATMRIDGVPDGSKPDLSWAFIERLERKALEMCQADDPTTSNVFLTDWKWLAPDPEAPAPHPHEARHG